MVDAPSENRKIGLGKFVVEIEVLARAMSAIDTGVTIGTRDRRIVFCNQAFQEITGWSEEEILGQTLSFLQGPERDDALVESMNDCMDQGQEFSREIENYKKSGEKFWNQMTIKPLFDEAGGVEYFVGLTKDVTNLRIAKDTEARLLEDLEGKGHEIRAIRDHLTSALRLGAIGTFDYYIDEDRQEWSPELISMIGASGDQFPAPSDFFISRIDPSDLPRFLSSFEAAIAQGIPYEITVKVHRYDYGHIYMQIVADVVGEGEQRRITGVARDVTTRMETAKLLAAESERFRIIANTVSDVLWDYDLVKGTGWLAPGWPQRLGLEFIEEKFRMPEWTKAIDSKDKRRVLGSLAAALRSGVQNWASEFEVTDDVEKSAVISVQATIVRSEDGSASRILGNARNISAEKRQQEGFTRARALEALGQLTGGVAHDFNNQLMIIQGNAELLEMTDLDEEQAECANLITQASQSAAKLNSRLLSFSSQSRLTNAAVELSELIPNVVALLKAGIPESISIDWQIPSGLWHPKADANALEQALVNLSLNSRDAMPNGGKLIISCENRSVPRNKEPLFSELKAGDYVVISLTDNGEGMDQEVLSKAFDPFFTTKEVGKGTGLGLSTVYGFARQSGGTATIYSEVGVGTTVSLFLPRFRATRKSRTIDVPTGSEAFHSPKRLLVVEDQPEVRSHVGKLLKRMGHEVTLASDAREALVLLDQHRPFDLLFTDVIMPGGMNGQQLAEKARKKLPDLKVLFTSGYPAFAFEHLGLEDLKKIRLLKKPYRTSELRNALADVMKD